MVSAEVLDDLRQIKIPPETPAAFPVLRKLFLLAMGILAIILLLSYILVTFPIADILKGKAESAPLQGKVLEKEGLTVIFENQTLERLQLLFLQEQTAEFSACLQGRVDGEDTATTYHVTSWYQPAMYRRLFNQVVFESCLPGTIILLHTHPYKFCAASATDLRTLKEAQETNPAVLMLVLCEPERMAVYRRV